MPERERRGWGPCALLISANNFRDWFKCSELGQTSARHGIKTVRKGWLLPIPSYPNSTDLYLPANQLG